MAVENRNHSSDYSISGVHESFFSNTGGKDEEFLKELEKFSIIEGQEKNQRDFVIQSSDSESMQDLGENIEQKNHLVPMDGISRGHGDFNKSKGIDVIDREEVKQIWLCGNCFASSGQSTCVLL